MFEKIYLDQKFSDSFHRICIQENLIDQDSGLPSDCWSIVEPGTNPLKKRTLLLLTLFDNVDSFSSSFELDRVVDIGLLNASSQMASGLKLHHNSVTDDALICEIVRQMTLKNNALKKSVLEWHYSARDLEGSDRSIWNYLSVTSQNCFSSQDKLQLFGAFVDRAINEIADVKKSTVPDISSVTGYRDIEEYVVRLADIVGASVTEGAQIISADTFKGRGAGVFAKPLDDVMCLAQVLLREEVSIFPDPKNLKDVLRLRQRPELIRFREVVSEWVATIQEGRADAESRIRRDVQLANADLKRLDSWCEFKSSPFAFWINAIGGHLPIVSNVITVINTFGDLAVTSLLKKRSQWALLLK